MGGHEDQQGRQASNRANDFSSVTPAPALTHPPPAGRAPTRARCGCSPSVDERQPAIRNASAATTSVTPTSGVTTEMPSSRVASNRAGRVSTSPNVETSGAVTLSRSQPKRTAPAVSPSEAASTTSEPSRPPAMDTVASASRSIDPASPRPTATALATTARASEMPMVSSIEASTFWPSTVPAAATSGTIRRGSRSTAGCRTRRRCCPAGRWRPAPAPAGPGRSASVPVMAPRNAPATRLVVEFSPSATRLCRAPAASGPNRARSRAQAGGWVASMTW